jgi:hypothetical protein
MLKLGCSLDLSGLETALRVEEAGAWHLFDPDLTPKPSKSEVLEVYNDLMSYSSQHHEVEDMGNLRLLIDAAAALHGHNARRFGWNVVGINPSTGRKILANKENKGVSWHLWFTALNFGLGFARYEEWSDYLLDRELPKLSH